MDSAWKSTEDFENDLWAFSEINEDDDETEELPPLSILQYNARIGANNTASIFDTQYSQEPVTYINTGRGRGGISQMFRPGNVVKNDREDEHTVQKYLREVSGLGYSNELIEKSFKKSTPQPIEEFCDAESDKDHDFSYLRHTPDKLKNTSSLSSPKKQSIGPLSNGNMVSSSPIEKNNVEPPLPLSIILSQGKKSTKTDKENTVRKKGCSLNPDAPEFQVCDTSTDIDFQYYSHNMFSGFNQPIANLDTGHSNGIQTKSSPNISPESDSPRGYQDYTSSEEEAVPLWRRNNIELSSSGDELSWRNRNSSDHEFYSRRNGSSGRDFTRNCNFNNSGILLHNDRAFETNSISWRQRDVKSFNIKSVNDFPPL